jgi:SAM-dependent methyltransferase
MNARRRIGAITWGIVAAGLIADTVRIRRRLATFPVLGSSGSTDHGPDTSDDWVVLSRSGITLPDDLVGDVAAYADAERLDVVDVVPADLAVTDALALLRDVDGTGRQAPLALGRGAAEVVVARRSVVERARMAASQGLDRYQMIESFAELKCHAPDSTGSVIAPALRSDPARQEQDRSALRAINGDNEAFALGARGVALAALALAPLTSRVVGSAALAAYSLQAPVTFRGSDRLRPRDLGRYGPARLVTAIGKWVRLVRSDWRSAAEPDPDAGRDEYAAAFAHGTDRLLEPARATCPWCGAPTLERRVTTTDLFQAKPGTFSLDSCTSCGHVFQNPRLSLEGLDVYYRDFYDGRGSFMSALAFGAGGDMYRRRADMVASRARPERWLDVGTGHAHFCVAAGEILPDTTFDGLDMTTAIEDAERRGWVSTGHRGLFPELAPTLAGRYDVVSMHHYLEHTREPLDELDAAAVALRPGGHLMIEQPDPESRLRKVLGRYWVPWFQPQHQHMPPHDNLCAALRERGFDIVASEFDGANVPLITSAALLWANNLIPSRSAPWMPRPTPWSNAGRVTVFVAATPLFLLAGLADAVFALVTAPFDRAGSGAYRVLAVKTGSPPASGARVAD